MLKIFLYVVLAILVTVGCQTIRNSGKAPIPANMADALRIATYNVHYIILRKETGAWSVGDWERRKGPLDQAFKAMNADVIGFQEMESFGRGSGGRINLTLDWLLKQNPDYAAAAVGDPATFPSTQPILYRKDRVRLLDQGWFFFSGTPDVIYSRTFNGSFPAFASWAIFTDVQTGAPFRVINIHTDYASRSNRVQTAALVADRMTPWIATDESVVLLGDLNARRGDRVVDILSDAGLTFAPVAGSTFHFNRGINLFGAIDHVAFRGAIAPISDPFVLRQKFDGQWPTDHYPVGIDLRITP